MTYTRLDGMQMPVTAGTHEVQIGTPQGRNTPEETQIKTDNILMH